MIILAEKYLIRKIMDERDHKAMNEELNRPSCLGSGSLRFSEQAVDFAYLCGVFNVSGIDGLHKEIQRLKAIGKDPHDIIDEFKKILC
jgi:antirestriction protein ArdC